VHHRFVRLKGTVAAADDDDNGDHDDDDVECVCVSIRSQMPAALPEHTTIEKTPSYFVTGDAAERVHNMSRDHIASRDIRLLVVIRDPVTRALSDYAQSASKRPELTSFEQMAFRGVNRSLVDSTWGPVRLGVYARFVGPWLRHFDRERLLFVRGERLVADPAAEMAAVQSFLGLRPLIDSRNFYFNATKGFPCLRPSTGARSKSSFCLGASKGRRHPPVDVQALRRLRRFYRPYNALFYEMTGVDFGWD